MRSGRFLAASLCVLVVFEIEILHDLFRLLFFLAVPVLFTEKCCRAHSEAASSPAIGTGQRRRFGLTIDEPTHHYGMIAYLPPRLNEACGDVRSVSFDSLMRKGVVWELKGDLGSGRSGCSVVYHPLFGGLYFRPRSTSSSLLEIRDLAAILPRSRIILYEYMFTTSLVL